MATGSARRRRKEAQGRGGPREGQQGKAYSNRSDLNQPKSRVAPSAGYGQRAAQEASIASVPLPAQGPPPAPASGGGAGVPAQGLPTGPPPVLPGSLGPLNSPTSRPNEPITTGLPTGPGAGPEALMGGGALGPVDEIRAMYAAYPTDDMRRLLAYVEGYGEVKPLNPPFTNGWRGKRQLNPTRAAVIGTQGTQVPPMNGDVAS